MKSKILIFYDFFPPAFKGGGIIRSVYNLSECLSEFYDIYVFTSNSDLGGSPIVAMKPNTWIQYSVNLKVFYSDGDLKNFKRIFHIMNSIKPDVIYLNGLFTPKFSFIPLVLGRFLNFSPLWVLAPRGMLQQGALSIKPLKKQVYLFVLKQFGLLSKVKWHATDQQEELDVIKIFGPESWVEKASNIPTFSVPANFNFEKKVNELKIVFLALVSPVKNLKYLIDLINEIPDNISIILDIYGPVKDLAYWKECQKSIKMAPLHVKIIYKGEIEPHKVNEILGSYHLFSLLSLGENFGHSIFESLIAGTPVLISDKTPWKELENYGAGWDVNLDNPSRIKNIILEIAKLGQMKYNYLRKGARKHAEDYLEKNDFKKQYQEIFELE
jgi:glycosyltransferase involved in cell wall biosynthesis